MITALVFTWFVLLVLCWLGWQLLRQNGRLLLQIESLEERLNEMEFAEEPAPEGLPVGSPAPGFELPDLAGTRRTLAQFRPQPLLLIFFNPDCGFCRDLAPKLVELESRPVGQAFQPAGSPDFPVRCYPQELATGKSPAPADRNVRPTWI